jgi:ascorbate-specific PTS system EIIC-type component UlaA
MKGNLIANTLILGILIIFYYLSLMVIQYIYSVYDIAFAGITDWRAAYDPYAWTFMNFFIYFVIPVAIIIGFIIHTKPKEETISLRRF